MSERIKHLAVYALSACYDLHPVETQRQGHAIQICEEAAREGYDAVIAFGGDGTVNEAANGLAETSTPLAVLPGGASNVFCRMLGMPNDVIEATEQLLNLDANWNPRQVDLGRANDRYFTFTAGVGLDAAVAERADRRPDMKARFGPPFFLESIAVSLFGHYLLRKPSMRVHVDGQQVDAVSTCVQNSDPYTYFLDRPIRLAEGATLTSGTLACVALTRAGLTDVPTLTWRLWSKRQHAIDHPSVTAFRDCKTIRVESLTDSPLPVHVDGDFIGAEVSTLFSVAPGVLSVIS